MALDSIMARARIVRLPPRRSADTRAPGDTPDAELVRRARKGDSEAEHALFTKHAPYIGALSFRLLRDRDESDDVVQETFADAISQLRSLSEPSSLRSWLAGIAVHKAHRRFRRRRLQRLLGIFRPRDELVLESCADAGTPPDLRAELALLDRALATLPDRVRAAWVLHYVEGYSLEETALLCKCSLATAKRRIGRAAAAVRGHVELGETDDV